MKKARSLIAISCACASAACGTEIARAVDIAPTGSPPPSTTVDAGPPSAPEKPPVCTTAKLTDRLLYGKVMLPEEVRYKRSAYFYGFPQDDRIAFSASSNGAQVAWLTSAGTQVHVTPIAPAEFTPAGNNVRAGDDITVDGSEVGGLVAFDDGFALLTRRPDLGEPIPESTGQATFLVRWKDKNQEFAVPLTGTRFATTADTVDKHDFPLPLSSISWSGRLLFENSQYGAYFGVRGGSGDRYSNQNSDKFVVMDAAGRFVSGFRAACRQNLGGRLLADTTGGFAPFCMSDGSYGTAGVYAVAMGPLRTIKLAPEVTFASGSYLGGNFGSAVKLPNGYVVAWASRGVSLNSSGQIDGPADNLHAPAIALLKKDLTLEAGNNPKWPFPRKVDSDGNRLEDAVNVHAQVYGDKVLLVWETITSPAYRPSTGVSVGNYGGTHFRLIDASGNIASDEEFLPTSIAPNGPDDIVQFPNGDVGWAYVPEDRYFQSFTAPNGVSALTEIRFVRLTYCTPPPP
jgi:hypothetical protein